MDVDSILMELDAQRVERGMSYQAVADACGVSKATIYRALTGVTEPTAHLLQNIAAAVQYKPNKPEPELRDLSPESYIVYLKEMLQQQKKEKDRQIRQLQAHYSMLRRQDRRTILLLSIAIALIISGFILWLIVDITHPNIGWIQRANAFFQTTSWSDLL